MDNDTERATRLFLTRAEKNYTVKAAFLFGSRARADFRPNSDADLAVLLNRTGKSRVDVALDMADIAFDVMLETGVLIEPLPVWDDEWANPSQFSNPQLIENIRREGIKL